MKDMGPIQITQRLVKVGRYSGNESDTADLVWDIMKELDFEGIEKMPCGSIVGWFGPRDKPVEVLFDSHIDIATVSGEWSFDPFCGEIQGDRLLGRGTSDMKAGLGASLYAVAHYAKNNKLDKRIAVSATVMEETIEGLGLEEVLDYTKPQNVVICEPSELSIMIGQKGRMEIILTLIGKSAHASNPEVGINSMLMGAKALQALESLKPPVDEVLGEGILVPTDIITEPYPSISAVPEKTLIRFDRRSLPGETEESILGEIAEVLRLNGIEKFTLEAVKNNFETYTGNAYERTIELPPWSISKDSNLFEIMYGSVKSFMDGIEPTISAWKCCTNGSESAGRRNIPTIGIGPGSLEQAHTVDEFINISEIENVSDIYITFLSNLMKK
jgi:putative selenium metabolism hydrolase